MTRTTRTPACNSTYPKGGVSRSKDSLEVNGSPPPLFETDDDRNYFLCTLPIHPLSKIILGQKDDLSGDKDNMMVFKFLGDINSYLSLSVSEIRDRDRASIREKINPTIQTVIKYCVEPKSRDEIFEQIGLYKNTKNFQNHIKPLIDAGWLYYSLPNKLTSRDQKYYTTELGKKLLAIISIESNSGIKRISVVSSNIASVGYDAEKKILEIEFHHGAIYQYFDVPKEVYDGLMGAESKGSYYFHTVKEKYKYENL